MQHDMTGRPPEDAGREQQSTAAQAGTLSQMRETSYPFTV